MTLLSNIWRYWKWLCVALMTGFVALAVLAAIVHYFKSSAPSRDISECLESGGAWDDTEGLCKSAA